MRQFVAVITIICAFLLAPLAADYFAAPAASWGIGVLVIAYESCLLLFKKTSKDLAEEQARLAEARHRVEQIKQEAASVYLQSGGKKGAGASSSMDVDRMSPVELANAARQIVHDIRGKKGDQEGGGNAPISKAA